MREVDQILIGADKGVQEAIVYLKAVEKGKAFPKLAKTPEIDNVKCDFEPHVMVMPVGDIVVVNTDPVLHNTKSFIDRAPIFNLALPNQGQRITRPIKKYRDHARRVRRPRLDARLGLRRRQPLLRHHDQGRHVRHHRHPPGSYTLVAWQEFTGATEIPVTVKAKEAAALDRGAEEVASRTKGKGRTLNARQRETRKEKRCRSRQSRGETREQPGAPGGTRTER